MTTDLHVIFGAGAIGLATFDALRRRGRTVRLVDRSGDAPAPRDAEVVNGDAANPDFAVRAARGAAVVYQTINPPYHLWSAQFPQLQSSVLAAAEITGARLVSMENVYMYGRTEGRPLTEDRTNNAHTKKGRLRARMAEELLAAHQAGRTEITIGRASDYFGPRGGAQSNLETASSRQPLPERPAQCWATGTSRTPTPTIRWCVNSSKCSTSSKNPSLLPAARSGQGSLLLPLPWIRPSQKRSQAIPIPAGPIRNVPIIKGRLIGEPRAFNTRCVGLTIGGVETPTGPRIVRAGEGDVTGEPGLLDRYLLESAASAGRVALVEHILGPKSLAAPMHRHSREDEYSFVLAGTLGVIEEGIEIMASPGDLVTKLRGRWHTFWNAGDDELRVLEIIVPGGLEAMFRRLAEPGGEYSPDTLPALAAEYGAEVDFQSTMPLVERYGLVF